jgi:hypothetical protein
VFSVVAHELLGQCAPDEDLHATGADLRSIDALADVRILLVGLDAFEHPTLIHAKVGLVEDDLVLL